MKYLVTGGAGFIGSNIVKELLNRGEEVRVLDNFATGKRENVLTFSESKNFEVIEGDLRSFHIVREAVKGVDFILHQGALPSVPRSINDPITSNDVNILGTLNILEAAKEFGVKKVVYASSSSIYGNSTELTKSEDLPVMPLSPYAISKYAAERYCQLFYQLYGLETVCLRYFNVFGPNQDPTSQYSAVIPKFIRAIINNISPTIFGDGLQSRDFTFVQNNVSANLLACYSNEAIGEAMNVACGQSFSLIELVNVINKALNKNIEPIFEKPKRGDIKHSLADISKANRLLKYEVKVPFVSGIEKTVEYYLNEDIFRK
jgi:UDP-glucose 4-epimerase